MSRMEMSHEQARELIAPYVLGALPQDEEPFVRAHILSCDECMAEADAYADVTSKIALSVEPVPLPDGFADRVLHAVNPGDPRDEVVTLQPARRNGWGRAAVAIAGIAASVTIVFLTVSLIRTRDRLGEYERVVSTLVHTDEGMELAGAGAVGRMIPSGGGSIFVVAGLREAPDNHTYQLWLLDDGRPVDAGTFDIDEGVALVKSELSLEGVEGAAVTVEPDGGSKGPTTEPILVSS